jgi:hypothetical protein
LSFNPHQWADEMNNMRKIVMATILFPILTPMLVGELAIGIPFYALKKTWEFYGELWAAIKERTSK